MRTARNRERRLSAATLREKRIAGAIARVRGFGTASGGKEDSGDSSESGARKAAPLRRSHGEDAS